MRGGIAERGGIRVGHRIIEINGQSVVATPHEKIISILTNAVGEVCEGGAEGALRLVLACLSTNLINMALDGRL